MDLVARRRMLTQVMDPTGALHDTRSLLGTDYDRLIGFRLAVEESVVAGEPRWLCPFCGEAAVVRCQRRHKGDPRSARAFHFKHKRHNASCPESQSVGWSQDQLRAAQYHGQREGPAHRRLKQIIFDSLTVDSRFADVRMETTWRGSCRPELWRRPDVSARYLGQSVVFEVQLSTTFVDVMAARRLFYRDEGVWLIWVVADFDPAWTTLAHETVFYPNNSNLFVANERTRAASLSTAAFCLEAHWLAPVLGPDRVEAVPARALVEFGALTVDAPQMRIFHFDVEAARLEAEAQLADRRREAATAARQADRDRLRGDFEALWFWNLQRGPAREDAEHFAACWQSLHLRARGLDLPLPASPVRLMAPLNALYSVRDAHAGLVGFDFANLLQLAHHVYEYQKPVLWPFRQALAAYQRGMMIRNLDATGKWRAKVQSYREAFRRDDPAYRTAPALLTLIAWLFPPLAERLVEPPGRVLARESVAPSLRTSQATALDSRLVGEPKHDGSPYGVQE